MPQSTVFSRVMTEASARVLDGISAAVKSPLPMSSSSARSICCARSFGTGTGDVIRTLREKLRPSDRGGIARRATHAPLLALLLLKLSSLLLDCMDVQYSFDRQPRAPNASQG